MVIHGPEAEELRTPHKRFVFRNIALLGLSAAASLAIFVYPTSRNHTLTNVSATGTSTVVPLRSDKVLTGSTIKTKYGPVQVQLRLRKGKIIAANAIQYPMDGGLSTVVSGRAVIKLNKEVLAAQFGHIDTISTATYTSVGYMKSLQSALDMAHLG